MQYVTNTDDDQPRHVNYSLTTVCLKGVATLVQGLFFSERVVNAWNSLPRETNFNSVAGFKRSIAKVDFTTFLKGDFMLS